MVVAAEVAAGEMTNHIFSMLYLTTWGVEPVVILQTSWLESTGVCGVQQNQAGGSSVQKIT